MAITLIQRLYRIDFTDEDAFIPGPTLTNIRDIVSSTGISSYDDSAQQVEQIISAYEDNIYVKQRREGRTFQDIARALLSHRNTLTIYPTEDIEHNTKVSLLDEIFPFSTPFSRKDGGVKEFSLTERLQRYVGGDPLTRYIEAGKRADRVWNYYVLGTDDAPKRPLSKEELRS